MCVKSVTECDVCIVQILTSVIITSGVQQLKQFYCQSGFAVEKCLQARHVFDSHTKLTQNSILKIFSSSGCQYLLGAKWEFQLKNFYRKGKYIKNFIEKLNIGNCIDIIKLSICIQIQLPPSSNTILHALYV